jgi:hypothetical protein
LCKQIYSVKGDEKTCGWPAYIASLDPSGKDDDFVLPHDGEDLCLFHSHDIEWKRKNYCFESFITLLSYLNDDPRRDEIMLQNFIVTGIELEDQPGHPNHSCLFERHVFRKPLLMFDCVFCDEVEMTSVRFLDELCLVSCEFKEQLLITECRFDANVDAYDNCLFRGTLRLHGNNFKSPFSIVQSTTEQGVDIDVNDFYGRFLLSDCQLLSGEENLYVMANFHNGFELRNNKTGDYLSLQECTFRGDCSIHNYSPTTTLHIEECTIGETFKFSGTNEQLLFSPDTRLNIEERHLLDGAIVTFDFCDFLNLNQDFLARSAELEKAEKVKINPTCSINRLQLSYEFVVSPEAEELFEDTFRLISRYFNTMFAVHLNVDIYRLTEGNRVQVTYTTREDISEEIFLNRLEHTVNKFLEGRGEVAPIFVKERDQEIQRQAIRARVQKLNEARSLSAGLWDKMLSHRGAIHVNVYANELFMGNKNENKQIGISLLGGVKQTNKVTNQGNTDRDVIEKITAAKREVAEHDVLTADQLILILELLSDLNDKVLDQNTVPKYMTKQLLSDAGSLASIAGLVQALGA